ncbi:MAG: DNA-directed RNA polymerase subunit beta', partial [Candidatus Marinimicrobia bacterium]|nr:DNA-directed RNA polymerase subunit beta' [Candidatus Neomarinimicrobiota bacterium]
KEGTVALRDFKNNETYRIEAVEGGKKQMVIIEAKNRKLSPHIEIIDDAGKVTAGGAILPVSATLVVRNDQKVQRGQTLVKIPRDIGKTRDITGGLPRVAELFEARTPSNLAVVSEIDGTVEFGEVKRGIRKISVTSSDDETRNYSIPYGKHVIVHEGDYITAGTALCEGSISPTDVLSILGPRKVREYLVNEIQEVYRLQGVKLNDKHIEVIVKQMMNKVSVGDPGDTKFLTGNKVNKEEFFRENDRISKLVVITDSGDSEFELDALVEKTDVIEINKNLKEDKKKQIKTRKAKASTFEPLLMGITRASLNTDSFLSAASFQETTRVLTDAATSGKTDYLKGLKENVAVGRLIPAGSGAPRVKKLMVADKDTELLGSEEIIAEAQ